MEDEDDEVVVVESDRYAPVADAQPRLGTPGELDEAGGEGSAASWSSASRMRLRVGGSRWRGSRHAGGVMSSRQPLVTRTRAGSGRGGRLRRAGTTPTPRL